MAINFKDPKVMIGGGAAALGLVLILRARKSGGASDTPLSVMDPASAFQFSQNAWPFGDQAFNMFGGPIPVHLVDQGATPPAVTGHHHGQGFLGPPTPLPGGDIPEVDTGGMPFAAAPPATAVVPGRHKAPGHRKQRGGRGNKTPAGGGGHGSGGGKRGNAGGGAGRVAHPANQHAAMQMQANHQMARSSAFGKPNVRASAHPSGPAPHVNISVNGGGRGTPVQGHNARPAPHSSPPVRSGASRQNIVVTNPNAQVQAVGNTGNTGRRRR